MTVTKTKPVLNAAEALIDRFIDHHRLPPTSRIDLKNRFKDLLGVVDAETGWDLMQKTLDDTSDEGMSHLKSAERIVVPFELASAAFGENSTMKARGELLAAVGQDVYQHTLKAWGASAGSLKPGTAPTTDDDEKVSMAPAPKEKETAGDSRANPFSENFTGTDEARVHKIAGLIKSLGTRVVQKMASSASPPRDIAGRVISKRN
jgi:hypothetical protein